MFNILSILLLSRDIKLLLFFRNSNIFSYINIVLFGLSGEGIIWLLFSELKPISFNKLIKSILEKSLKSSFFRFSETFSGKLLLCMILFITEIFSGLETIVFFNAYTWLWILDSIFATLNLSMLFLLLNSLISFGNCFITLSGLIPLLVASDIISLKSSFDIPM